MSVRTRVLAAAAALALSAALPTAATATAEPSAADAPGTLLSASPTSFHPLPLQPTNTDAWHINYRSTTAKGAANTVSGTVIVPKDGRKGPRPLVTYAVGTVGMGDQCAPSAGFPYGTTVEATLINAVVQRGWAVAVTDYEGLGTPGDHTYTVGRAEGQAVLDAARAAMKLPASQTGLTPDSPVGIMGYSQGGQASSWAAELHDSYAPELNVKGTATGGVPADLMEVAKFNDGNLGAGLILMAAAGHDTAYPELKLDSYLNQQGKAYVDFMRKNCVAINAISAPFKRISEVTTTNPLESPAWQAKLAASRLGTHAPDHPVYLYHGGLDELIPYKMGTQLRADWCARGAKVQWRSHPLLEHIGGVTVGAFPAMDWLGDRFAGRPATGNC
ncbi:lipase family protein [Streptomyces sp. NBC_00237]|uniref:lipase family protein n=1 Tax=Streptomyces sp. NBC_00237 TaxID=2975687 RepID=UPI0022589895|nr:lipase family protein [Streptomyces sp. NBC_00237]MCX5204967.1 lipase family protein [Streptomyces sp. NBC_00237]